jgi:alkylated DNA repair dioxygenase AlkB
MTQIIYTPIIDGNKSVFVYKSNFFDKEFIEKVRTFVTSQEYRDGHCVSGREIPRKQLWFQRDKQYFCNTWKNRYDRWESAIDYPTILTEIANVIKNHPELSSILENHNIDLKTMDINSCLVNKYRDGDDSIRAHRDTYLSFGTHPIIIGISLGDSRILRVRRLHHPEMFKSLKVQKASDENIDFLMEDNSLFIMAGHSQIYFSHEVPKMEGKDVRYSLTFREFIDNSDKEVTIE